MQTDKHLLMSWSGPPILPPAGTDLRLSEPQSSANRQWDGQATLCDRVGYTGTADQHAPCRQQQDSHFIDVFEADGPVWLGRASTSGLGAVAGWLAALHCHVGWRHCCSDAFTSYGAGSATTKTSKSHHPWGHMETDESRSERDILQCLICLCTKGTCRFALKLGILLLLVLLSACPGVPSSLQAPGPSQLHSGCWVGRVLLHSTTTRSWCNLSKVARWYRGCMMMASPRAP